MVLYFTSTGNSKFIANRIAKDLNKDLISLNDIFKNNKKWEFHSTSPFILVSPIYAWRLPKKLENFLKTAKFNGNNEIYILVTMGKDCGLTQKYCKKIIENRNMILKGFEAINMPDNYFIGSTMNSKEKSIEEIKQVIPKIDNIKNLISENKSFFQNKYNKNDWFLSSIGNWGFNTFMANSKSFKVSNKCTKCKKCINNCPINNITLENEKINFNNNCIFCLGCLHKCPVQAIDYKGNIEKNGQYIFPKELEI